MFDCSSLFLYNQIKFYNHSSLIVLKFENKKGTFGPSASWDSLMFLVKTSECNQTYGNMKSNFLIQ